MKKTKLILCLVLLTLVVWLAEGSFANAEILLYRIENEQVTSAEIVDYVDCQQNTTFVRKGDQVEEIPPDNYQYLVLSEPEVQLYAAMNPTQKQIWSLNKATDVYTISKEADTVALFLYITCFFGIIGCYLALMLA